MGRHTDNIAAKATRLEAEGKITQAGSLWKVEGDHGSYFVTVEGVSWDARCKCDCPATGHCSHAQAVYAHVTRDSDPFEGLV